jgi:hypothetical protein
VASRSEHPTLRQYVAPAHAQWDAPGPALPVLSGHPIRPRRSRGSSRGSSGGSGGAALRRAERRSGAEPRGALERAPQGAGGPQVAARGVAGSAGTGDGAAGRPDRTKVHSAGQRLSRLLANRRWYFVFALLRAACSSSARSSSLAGPGRSLRRARSPRSRNSSQAATRLRRSRGRPRRTPSARPVRRCGR